MARLGLFALPIACEVVQSPILHKSSKGEDEADRDEQIHGRHIRHLWQGLPRYGAQCRHGKHSCDP